jgi:dCMP deaminase
MEKRSSKEKYYLDIAKAIGRRSTCFRNLGGAIIVRGDQIISTGYVGAPRKTKDCFERGECLRDKLKIPHGRSYEICRSVHAEMNAIINAARAGVSLFGGDIYLYCEDPKTGKTLQALPCFICKRMIINAGLERFIGSTPDGGLQEYNIQEWIKDWQEKDIVDDKQQFGQILNKEEGYEK